MYLGGVSTRRVGEVLEIILGYKISAQGVSNAARELDWEIKKYHRRALEDHYRYLLLDGVVLKTKGPQSQRKKEKL